uniref:ERCC4 domain-containing protein n=1 Tax=Grammatophora oceanica TaxID=210454 RepID=A0A6U5PLK6_9STRA
MAPNDRTGNMQLSIHIDDRERNRNHTPRELRTKLTDLVNTGLVKAVWPTGMPRAVVEEHSLSHGDFAFFLGEGEAKQRLSVALERKRIGDLVQRSVKGDHWKQFCKMRDSFDYAIFLVEYDTRQASRFRSEGEQGLDSWNPFETYVNDESSVFLYFGRSLMSHRSWRVIQTASEQASLRAVGALGLMASHVPKVKHANTITSRRDEQLKLQYRLSDAGTPWQLARAVAREVGSEARLEELYRQTVTEEARMNLFCQMARFITVDEDVEGSPEGWSAAIYHAFFSILSDPTEARSAFSEYKESVSDHSQLLCALHSIPSHQSALEAVSTGVFAKRPNLPIRSVVLHASKDAKTFIETPTEKSFWSISDSTEQTVGTVRMQTFAGRFRSLPLVIRVFSASDLIARVTDMLSDRNVTDFVGGARNVASGIMEECTFPRRKHAYRLILLRGLPAALTAAAKKPGCRPELSVMVDLVLSNLMLEQNVVVIQAVRKQEAETKLILRQLLLASLHYAYLTEEDVQK